MKNSIIFLIIGIIMWETGQLYFESDMFGQYVSRIFYEINKAKKGE